MKYKTILAALLAAVGAADAKTVKVSSFGYDPTDSTAFIRAAIESDADEIVFDKAAGDWVVGPLFITNSHMRIVFDKGVTVRGLTGCPEDVRIDATENNVLRVVRLNHAKAVLSGVAVGFPKKPTIGS